MANFLGGFLAGFVFAAFFIRFEIQRIMIKRMLEAENEKLNKGEA